MSNGLSKAEDHPEFAKLDALAKSLIASVGKKQADYFAVHKKYFQGLEMPTAECDGFAEHKVSESLKPTDQGESWADFDSKVFGKDKTLPFKISLDIYKAPDHTWGWLLTCFYTYQSKTWLFVHDEGGKAPIEAFKPDAWTEVKLNAE